MPILDMHIFKFLPLIFLFLIIYLYIFFRISYQFRGPMLCLRCFGTRTRSLEA